VKQFSGNPSIVIGFSYSRDFKGWLIRKAIGGYWNHTWIGYTDPVWGGKWVAHATKDGVVVQPAEELEKHYEVSVGFKIISDLEVLKAMRETRDYIGLPYDYRAVIINGLLLLLYKLTGVQWFDPVINQNKLSCSEFVALILQRANFLPVQERNAELYSPDGKKGLFSLLLQHPSDMQTITLNEWLRI